MTPADRTTLDLTLEGLREIEQATPGALAQASEQISLATAHRMPRHVREALLLAARVLHVLAQKG